MSYFVVDQFIKVLDKNVALTGLAEGGVTLRPHDPAKTLVKNKDSLQRAKVIIPCTVFDRRVVELV